MIEHTVVVGGTGMLRAASLELSGRSKRLTSIARTTASLDRLDGAMPAACSHRTFAVDYRDERAFAEAVTRALSVGGPAGLALGWFHENGPAQRFAEQLARESAGTRFFHVVGSAAADPARGLSRERFDSLAELAYHRVTLGYVREPSGSRWLTHEEISAGVLDAIDRSESERIVGQLRPGSERP